METNLDELYGELNLVCDAIRRTLRGEPYKYTIGSRSAENRGWTLTELKTYKKELESEIDDLENQLDGTVSRRRQQGVIFRDW